MSAQNRPWHFGSDGSSPLVRVQRAGYRGKLLGELISEYGIPNQGLSLIIFAGIVSQIPANILSLLSDRQNGWWMVMVILVILVLTIFAGAMCMILALIGTIGHLFPADIGFLLTAIEETLAAMGITVPLQG